MTNREVVGETLGQMQNLRSGGRERKADMREAAGCQKETGNQNLSPDATPTYVDCSKELQNRQQAQQPHDIILPQWPPQD